jgi:ribosome maturation factor RimP
MSTPERVRKLVEPLVADHGLDLYDLEFSGGVLRVVVSQSGGIGMDAIYPLTKAISRALDEADPIPGGFTLEVSSPGLERALRTPAHFRGAIGSAVTVKTHPGVDRPRRARGTLETADDIAITIVLDEPAGERQSFDYDQIERARTVFDWGPAPKPGKGPSAKKSTSADKSASRTPTATEQKVPAS